MFNHWKIGGEFFFNNFVEFFGELQLVVWENLCYYVTSLGSYVEACQNAWENI